MGDVYGIIQVAIQVLTPLINAKVSLHSGLKDDVNAINYELQRITAFLMNADERAEGDDVEKDWVRQVRKLAYDIEDAIERYLLYQKENAFSKAKHHISKDVCNMSSNIKLLRETASDIASARQRYSSNKDSNVIKQNILPTSLFQCTMTMDYEVVQDDTAKGKIIELLRLQNVSRTFSSIAVVGMRGLGKTTVVNNVYYDNTIRSNFACRVWISMVECEQQVDIIRKMIERLSSATNKIHTMNVLDSMDERSLLELLQRYIEGKRCMIVFDNVHEGDIKRITFIKSMLHSNREGSKILITTRYENVAYAWLNGSINGMYKLKPLPTEKAWELFCKKTFQSSGGSCPSHLHDLAKRIVKKCGGLPPVINSVGMLLSSKAENRDEWDRVCNSLGFYIDTKRQLSGIHKTFMLSYYDLPFYLKPCFLYFGIFPKGYLVSRMRLIRLWIAEGFIKDSKRNLTLEEVAEEYMSELINMSMIEVKSTDPTGKVRTVGVVSKFLHEMILLKMDELSFCKIISKKRSIGNESSRRLSIYKKLNEAKFLDNISQSKSSIIRSLLIENVEPTIMVKVLDKTFLKSINLLKVLDLFNAPIEYIPKEVGLLLNLHYLSLRSTKVSALPKTLGKLEDLQTLDLKQTLISELPKEFIQLRKLRHLLGYYYEYNFSYDVHCMKTNGMKIPEGLLGKCLELQRLAFLDLNAGHRTWAMELRSLTQLRKLGIVGLKFDEGSDMCSVIDGMAYLEAFSVFSKSKSEIIDLKTVKSPPLMLKRLYLNGPLSSFPSWINQLHGLVKIRLRWSNLHDDLLMTLQLLPNLVELQLLEAFIGEQLKIESGGFQKLKILHLLDLHNLKSLFIAEGALPLLDEMQIGESKSLQVPSGIKHLSNLTKLNFFNMPSHFTNLILPDGRYYSVVKHVPSVLFHYKDSTSRLETFTLQ